MSISLGTFVCACIEARFGRSDIDAVVTEALRDYAGRIETGSPLLPVPRFSREAEGSGEGVELAVSIASRPRRILEGEARRQGVTFEELARHAIFVYVGDSRAQRRHDLARRLAGASWHRPIRSRRVVREAAVGMPPSQRR